MQDVIGLKDTWIKTIVMYSIMKTLIVCTTLDCRILKNSITDLNWMKNYTEKRNAPSEKSSSVTFLCMSSFSTVLYCTIGPAISCGNRVT